MKRNRIKAVLTAMATVVSVLALCLSAVACGSLSVWQFDDRKDVNGYTASAISGTAGFALALAAGVALGISKKRKNK